MTVAPDVRLRVVEDDDVAAFYEHQADPVATEMAAVETRAWAPFVARWATFRADRSIFTRAIVVDGRVAGHIASWVDGDRRMVGYWIGRDEWGRGYATQALRILLDEVPERPMFAHVALDNIGSRRVLEHCGFVVAGEAEADDGVRESILRLD
jgi:RimJ/RimL family protein N-acetyltransferase